MKHIVSIAIGDQPSIFKIAEELRPITYNHRMWDHLDHLPGSEQSPQVWQLTWLFCNAKPAQTLASDLKALAQDLRWDFAVDLQAVPAK